LEFWDKNNGFLVKPFTKTEKKSPKKKKSKKSTKGSTKSPFTSTTNASVLMDSASSKPSDIGIPCWLINRVLHINFDDFIPALLKSTVDSETSHEQQLKYENVESPLLQSVLSKPKTRTFKKTEVFCITDYVEKTDILVGFG
jgi:hypothetical protein